MKLPKVRQRVRNDGTKVWFAEGYCGWNYSTGKRVRRKRDFPDAMSEADAQRMSDLWFTNIDRTTGESVDGTLGGWARSYIRWAEANRRPSTAKSYASLLRSHFPEPLMAKRIDDVRRADVREWAQFMEGEGFATQTCRSSYVVLRNIFAYAISMEWDGRNVAKEADVTFHGQGSPSRALEPDELAALREACSKSGETLAAAVELALATGMRIGEVCAFDTDSAMFFDDNTTLVIDGSVTEATNPPSVGPTKSGRPRNISVVREASDMIRARFERLHAEYGEGRQYYVSRDGAIMRPSDLTRMFTNARKAAGIADGVTFHSLRHTHATGLLHAGVPVAEVSRRLGHSSEVVTYRIYSHAMKGDDAVAAAAAASMFSGGAK